MTTPITDTLEFYKQLTRVGISDKQAEVFAATQAEISSELIDVNHKLELVSRDLTIRCGAMMVTSAIATIGIILAVLPHLVK